MELTLASQMSLLLLSLFQGTDIATALFRSPFFVLDVLWCGHRYGALA